jgi:hypothetical protein
MSWTWQANRGTAANKTAGTTIQTTPSASLASGQVIIVTFAGDNQGTTDGATTSVSCADDQSNSWTRLFEYTRTSGAADDGVTLAVFYSLLDTTIGTGDNITVSFSSITSKSIGIEEFSITGDGVTKAGENGNTGSGTTPSVSLSGLASSTEYLWIGSVGIEGKSSETITRDTDYSLTTFTTHGNIAGSPTSNTAYHGDYRIFTGTADTWAPTLGTSRDYACALGALEETSSETPASDNQQAFIQGKDTSSDSSGAFIQGKDTSSDSQPAFLQGQDTASDSSAAFIQGKDTSSDSQPAFLAGGLDVSDSQPAFFQGQDTASDSQSSFIQGKDTSSDSQEAYIEGAVAATPASDSQLAYIDGSDTLVEILGNEGHLRTTNDSQSYARALMNASDIADVATIVKFQFGNNDAQATFRIVIRSSYDWFDWQSPTDGYEAAIDSDGTYNINKIVSGSRSLISGGSGTWNGDGGAYWIRLYAVGTAVKFKIWADGGGEPGWEKELTDSDVTSGALQLGLFRQSGTVGHDLYLDDISYYAPYVPDSQGAYIAGKDTATDSQIAYIAGTDTASDSQIAYIAGKDTATDSQEAYIAGTDTAVDSQEAYIAGGINVSDSKSAYINASAVPASDSKSAYIAGTDTASDSQEAYIAGTDTASDSQIAYIAGKDAATDSQEAYLAGTADITDSQIAYIAGKDTASDSQEAYLAGTADVTDNQEAYIAGTDTALDSQEAYIVGGINVSDSIPAYIEGTAVGATDNQAAYIAGTADTSDNQEAYIAGTNTASASQQAYLAGKLASVDSQPAYLAGQDTAADNQEAYIVGTDEASDSQQAYLAGKAAAVLSQSAYMAGTDTASDSQEAYVAGGINVLDSASAYIAGVDTASDSQQAYMGVRTWFPFTEDFTGTDTDPWPIGKWTTSEG